MKIALISDIHGNIFALDAVLEDAKKNGADTYIFVGDYIYYMPFDNEVTERIRSLQTAFSVYAIAGNKEAGLMGFINADKSSWTYEQMGAGYQGFRELKTENLDWLKSMPETFTIQLPGNRKLLAQHIFTPLFPGGTGRERTRNALNSSGFYKREHMGSRFSHEEYLQQISKILTDDSYVEKIAEYDADIIVSGHTHRQWYAFAGKKLLINPGGCGQPLDGNPLAPYTLLTVTEEGIQIDERRISYDIEAAVRTARNTKTYKHGRIFSESCFLSMQSGYCYISELLETARRIAVERGTRIPVKEPVDNDIWRLAGHEFLEAHGIKYKQSIRLIVTDLDRTLLSSDKTISEYTADVLIRCRKNGIKVVFATARSKAYLTEYLQQINVDGLCMSNGSVVMEGDKELARYTFENSIQNSIITELKNDPSVYRISAKSAVHSYYLGKSANDYDTPYNFPADCTECFNTIAFRSLNPERILSLLERVDSVRYYRVTGEELVDILPVNATKWNAIRLLAKKWSIDLSEIAAFGDDYNDIEMLQNCGVGVAVLNALDEVKAVANYICCSNDEDGVARWLEENVL